MFKLESYVTPILLSYVDKYIKNLKPEDSQLSLWDGDASFCNLDLRLDVLEEDLNLPFTLVNGHIHELRIHVPWIKLGSEPVVITINTIECILKLHNESQASENSRSSSSRKVQKKQDLLEPPPGYVQSIINRTFSNICIVCNNLILKYVEDDIVLSLNIKSAEIFNVDDKWERAFVEITQPEAIMRRLVKMQDLTVCLDKRDASGKIEAYQDPLLYRCSTVWRIYSVYNFNQSKQPLVTRINMLCDKLDFSLTDQQLPMFVRLVHLCYLLRYKNAYLMGNDNTSEDSAPSKKTPVEDTDLTKEETVEDSSWTSWMWSFVPEMPTLMSEDDGSGEDADVQKSQKVLQFGIFIDKASCVFKVTESFQDSCYGSAKYVFSPFAVLHLYGCSMEGTARGPSFFNVQMGITGSTISGLEKCACRVNRDSQDKYKKPFFRAGMPPGGGNVYSFLSSTLFDPLAPENCGLNRKYCFDQEQHLSQLTEEVLVKRFPAFAFDYVYELQVPDDWLDKASAVTSTFLEESNWKENSVCRLVIGPFCADINSDMVHFCFKIFKCAKTYDSPPYLTSEMRKLGADAEVSDEDIQSAKEHTPMRTLSLTLLKPILRVYVADHFNYDLGTKSEKKRLKKSLRKLEKSKLTEPSQLQHVFELQISAECIDMKLSYPMYPKRVARVVQALEFPPEELMNFCFTNCSLKLFGYEVTLLKNSAQRTGICERKIIPSTCATFSKKSAGLPHLWASNSNFPLEEMKLELTETSIEIGEEEFLFALCLYQSWIKNSFEDSKEFETFFSPQKDTMRVVLTLETEGIDFSSKKTALMTLYRGQISTICVKLKNSCSSTVLLNAPESTSSAYKGEAFLKGNFDVPRKNGQYWFTFSAKLPNSSSEAYELSVLIGGASVCLEPALLTWWTYDPNEIFTKNPNISFQKVNDSQLTDDSPCSSTLPSGSQTFSQSQSLSADTWFQTNLDFLIAQYLNILQHLHLKVELASIVVLFPVSQWSVSKSSVQHTSSLNLWQRAIQQHELSSACILCLPSLQLENSSSQNVQEQEGGSKQSSHHLNVPKKEKESTNGFSWALKISDFSVYTVYCQSNLEKIFFILDPCGVSATLAITSKSIQNQLAVCVHVDTTSVTFSNSVAQVHILLECIRASYNSIKFAKFLSLWVKYFMKKRVSLASSAFAETKTVTAEKPSPNKNEKSMENNDKLETEVAGSSALQSSATLCAEKAVRKKISVWVQLTFPKMCTNFYGKFSSCKGSECFNFQVLAEEVITSLDVQNVYTKAKIKISTLNANILTKRKDNMQWSTGLHDGVVLCCSDKLRRMTKSTSANATATMAHRTNPKAANKPFLLLTCTKALCRNAKQKWIKDEANLKETNFVPSKYICEVDLELKQFDVFIWTSLFKAIYKLFMLFKPFLYFRSSVNSSPETFNKPIGINFSNQSLPLLYIKASMVRLFFPSSELPIEEFDSKDSSLDGVPNQKMNPDTLVLCFDGLNLTSQVENPLSRIILKQDLYNSALNSKSIFFPGSDIEDRQYQLDIYGLSFGSVVGTSIANISCLKKDSLPSHLPIMGENPALEWNIGVINESRNLSNLEPLLVVPVVSSFDVRIAFAPAIVSNCSSLDSNEEVIVSGITVEISIRNDIFVYLSPKQMQLISVVMNNSVLVLKNDEQLEGHMKFEDLEMLLPHVISRDSGIESEMSSLIPGSSVSSQPSLNSSELFVPFEALVTAGSMSLILFIHESDLDSMNTNSFCSDKKKQSHLGPKCSIHRKSTFVESTLFEKQEDGYDGSSDSSEEEIHPIRKKQLKLHPIFCISIIQPHTFLKCHPEQQRFEISCFDLHMKGPCPCHHIVETDTKCVPSENDYPMVYLETKPGEANNKTGIPPALCTVTLLNFFSENAKTNLIIGRPVKFKLNTYLWDQCELFAKSLIFRLCRTMLNKEKPEEAATMDSDVGNQVSNNMTFMDLLPLESIDLSAKQMVVALDLKDCSTCMSLFLSIDSIETSFSLRYQERNINSIKYSTTLAGFVIKVATEPNKSWPLLLPMSLKLSGKFQLWQFSQLKSYFNGEAIVLNMSVKHVQAFMDAINEIKRFLESKLSQRQTPLLSSYTGKQCGTVKHWHDDLRKGTFSFIKAPDGKNVQPKENQIVFIEAQTNQRASMTWRYPEPRVLTNIEVSPVPLHCDVSEQNVPDIHCYVQSWDSLSKEFIRRCDFHLSETNQCSLDLHPVDDASVTYSEVWQVVMEHKENSEDPNKITAFVSPLALVACMCIDSSFDPNYVPSIQIMASLPILKLNFYYNYPGPKTSTKLSPFAFDGTLPNSQEFLSISAENNTFQIIKWPAGLQLHCNSAIMCELLEYRFLLMFPILDSVGITTKATASYEGNKVPVMEIESVIQPASFRITQSLLHTCNYAVHYLTSEMQGSNALELCTENIPPFYYMICNNTNEVICFGQSSSDELITLHSQRVHTYSWRTHKLRQTLQISLQNGKSKWSDSFSIDHCGQQILKLQHKCAVYVEVRQLSNLQKQVVFHGALRVFNCLDQDINLKLVPCGPKGDVGSDAQSEIKSCIRNQTIVSVILSTECIDFYLSFKEDSESWSLCTEINKTDQSQLIKVPGNEGKVQNIWLQTMIKNHSPEESSMSVFLSPPYIVCNDLPCTLLKNVSSAFESRASLPGKGCETQLFDELYLKNDLKFSFDKSVNFQPDLVKFAVANAEKVKSLGPVKEELIYENLNATHNVYWPYTNLEVSKQKVHFENQLAKQLTFCSEITNPKIIIEATPKWPGLNTPLISVKPWAMFINTLDIKLIVILDNGVEMKLIPNSISMPPYTEKFHLAVLVKNEMVKTSQFLLLEKERTKQVQIEGAISPSGSINVTLHLKKCCKLLIFQLKSEMYDGINIITFLPAVNIQNNSNFNFHLNLHAMPLHSKNVLGTQHSITSSLVKGNNLQPLLYWEVDENLEFNCSLTPSMPFALCLALCSCISSSHLWSRHLWLPPELPERKRLTVSIQHCVEDSLPLVISSHRKNNAFFLFLSHDPSPLLLLHNQSNVSLCYGQSYADSKTHTVYEESEENIPLPLLSSGTSDYYTFPSINMQYPVSVDPFPKLHLGFQSKRNAKFFWSPPIDVSYNTQFVSIPDDCHLRINKVRVGHTTNLFIDAVNKIEFTAKEVRSRIGTGHHSTLLNVNPQSYVESSESSAETSTKPLKATKKEQKIFNTSFKPVSLCLTLRALDISLAICNELNDRAEYCEVLRVNMNNIMVFSRTRQSLKCSSHSQELCLCFKSIQIDNQFGPEENTLYDFPVILKEHVPKTVNDLEEYSDFFPNKAKDEAFLVVNLLFSISEAPQKYFLESVDVSVLPMSLYLEDTLYYKLTQLYESYLPFKMHDCCQGKLLNNPNLPMDVVHVYAMFVNPIRLKHLKINMDNVYLTVHASLKLYLSIERSVLKFQDFEKEELFTNFYELGRITVVHYLTGALFRAGWVVGSLDLLGNPANFARAVGTGIADFVCLPYYGLLNGPRAFLTGLSHGTSSLFSGISSGAITCVTNLATSISRNMDFLSMDSDHLARQEMLRRHLPSGVAGGLLQGLSGLGLSLLGAVAGVVDHPLQVLVSPTNPVDTAKGILGGFAKGLIGVITKPVGGAAEFVSQTGHGLLQGAGWLNQPIRLHEPIYMPVKEMNNSMLKFFTKIVQKSALGEILFFVDSTHCDSKEHYEGNTLLLTTDVLCVFNVKEDAPKQTFSLTEIKCEKSEIDKKAIVIVHCDKPGDHIYQEMCKVNERVADYVQKNWFSDTGGDLSKDDIREKKMDTIFQRYNSATIHFLAPNLRNIFLDLFNIAQRKLQKKGFSTNC